MENLNYDPKKIELLAVRLLYYYRSKNDSYQFDQIEFKNFCYENYPIIKYSYDLGEYCKSRNPNLSNFAEIGPGFSRKNYEKASDIFKGILSFCSILHKDNKHTCKVIEEIQYRISNRWYICLCSDDKYPNLASKNGGSHLIRAFIAGAMDISEENVKDLWQAQIDRQVEEEERMAEFYSNVNYQDYPDEPLSEEDAIMSALENGNGEVFGF